MLELGAGTALPGLLLAKLGARVTLTDAADQPEVLANLEAACRDNDLEVNVIKGKKLSNVRASGTDDAAKVAPKIRFSLEEAMEYIRDDEYLEITPLSIRMRKIG